MLSKNDNACKTILISIGIAVVVIGVVSFFITPSLFPDPAIGFQALRSMQLGGGFNNIIGPDQGDISKPYIQFLTWWSPGQYMVPHFFRTITGLNLGAGITITVTMAEFCGLAGFYCLFTKLGFSKNIAAISLLFIICQRAFMIPHIYYNGGEILLFAFNGWFLYGCISLKKPGLKLVVFVLLSGFTGFFFKSSFLWMYGAGLCCCWIGLSLHTRSILTWIKNGLWIGVPAVIAFIIIYLSFISKGESPVTAPNGIKPLAAALSYPLASPFLAGFSVDDLFNGLMDHTGPAFFNDHWSVIVVMLIAILSVTLVWAILRYVPNNNYRVGLAVFYITAALFFGYSYWRQLNVSMESRHFRIIGILIVPGIIYLVSGFKPVYKVSFAIVLIAIACNSAWFLIGGFKAHHSSAKGITGIAQPNIDQASLNQILKLDVQNKNLTFVFFGDDVGLEILHNNIIPLQPIGPDLKIDTGDYTYVGHAGPLYILLPAGYKGAREQIALASFPGYKDFKVKKLSDKYLLYSAK